jgi:hypothetical protein
MYSCSSSTYRLKVAKIFQFLHHFAPDAENDMNGKEYTYMCKEMAMWITEYETGEKYV